MSGKYQWFQRHVENFFVNQMKNGNTLNQRIIENRPWVTTVAGPQNISFQYIKRKHRSKTAAYAIIHILYPPVDEVVIENEKNS